MLTVQAWQDQQALNRDQAAINTLIMDRATARHADRVAWWWDEDFVGDSRDRAANVVGRIRVQNRSVIPLSALVLEVAGGDISEVLSGPNPESYTPIWIFHGPVIPPCSIRTFDLTISRNLPTNSTLWDPPIAKGMWELSFTDTDNRWIVEDPDLGVYGNPPNGGPRQVKQYELLDPAVRTDVAGDLNERKDMRSDATDCGGEG